MAEEFGKQKREDRKVKRSLLIFFAVVCFTVNQVFAQKPVDKIPYTLSDDFETGELYGWEPYPYAQDIGFDALYFTSQTPTHNNSRFALARPVKANDVVELNQGFTKRLNLWTTPETRIKAAVYFQTDRKPEALELSVGTFDGRRYRHRLNSPEANRWVEVDVPLEAFQLNCQPLAAGEHLQVVTLEASYPVVYYLYTYTIFLDDFQINGDRQRRFVGREPATTDLEMFDLSVLNKHFFYGDNISLSAASEGNIPLRQVLGTLLDSKGRVVKDNIPFRRQGDSWTNNAIHRLTPRDARGQWEIKLTGQTDRDPEVRWGFRFLVPGKPVTAHPRLLFSSEELQQRLATEKSPVAKRILDRALENTDFMEIDVDAIKEGKDRTAENLVGGPYSKTTVGFNAYGEWSSPNRRLGKVIEEGSFRYAFTGDRKAGEKAKKALLQLCSFEKWNAAWMLERKFWTYYPVGYTLLPVAYGYDLLHDLLTAEEQKVVREAIMEKGLKLFHRDMVEMNRMPSNQTNHIAVLAAGHGLAATAIYGEDPDNPYLEPYLSGIMTKVKAFLDRTYYEDGSYGEPKSGYMNMATKEIVLIFEAFERNFGIDWATTTAVQNFYKYPLQAMHLSGLMADFGDGGHAFTGFTQNHAAYFVYRTGNPFLYQYIKPYWEEGKGGYLGYLWYRDDLTPASRESLPTSKVFEAQGMVMRSGWADTSTVISIRIGPHSNHYHFDQGSFQLMTNGEELLSDPGIGTGGYYANLDFPVYNIQAIAHNVMLVDHDAESQTPAHFDNDIAALRDWPRMVHTFAGEMADAVEGDLTSVYKGKLETYHRTLLYTKSGPLFLFDKVKSKSPEGHVYDWLFHAPQNEGKRSISYNEDQMTIDRPNARLTLQVVSPEIQPGKIRDRQADGESFIALSSEPNLTEASFLAVLLPEAKPATGSYGPRPTTTRVDEPGWIGARVERPGAVDFGFFRTGLEAAGTVQGFATDAVRFTASFDGKDSLLKAYFEGSSFSGRDLSVKSGAPVTCAIAPGASGTALELKSGQETELAISFAQRPSRVLLNGSAIRNWHYDVRLKTLTLKVPKGRNDLSIQRGLT